MRFPFCLIALATCVLPLHAQPLDDGPKSPQESLKCIKVRPGFTVELMAHEPVVQDPIAFAWGADGKFWVVEMGDYPLGTSDMKGGGRIKILEKSKADGPYDKATLFLDGLSYPTGVTPWKNGVLVTCAPDIFYAEDTNGDGKADKKEVLFTGFHEGNQQHRVNGLVYGLDGWFYGANGDSGGVVTSVKTKKKTDIRGRDFRLKPDTGEFETATGQTQFGRCRDDFGNWFGCNNSNPLYHFVLEEHYMSRNPYLIPPAAKIDVSVTPGASRVYPISKPQPRFNTPGGLNHFTSACSAIIYRDDFFGAGFYGNSFVSEPVHNLIHREVMGRKGITFTSNRADDEKESEFLASSDNWFRPTTIAVGPDGCLWIADMYRQVIEHPEWIPKDWQKKVDLRAGHDKGRIYRVYLKDKSPRAVPKLASLMGEDLNAELKSPSGWVRDNAQRLMVERRVRPQNVKQIPRRPHPSTPIHMLMVSALTSGDPEALIGKALSDSHPEVVRWAFRAMESAKTRPDTWQVAHETASRSNEPLVRMQAALSWNAIGRRFDAGPRGLGRFLSTDESNPYLMAAALSSLDKETLPQFAVGFALTAKGVPPSLLQYASRTESSAALVLIGTQLRLGRTSEQEAMMALAAAYRLSPTPRKPIAQWVTDAADKQDKESRKVIEEIEAKMANIASQARKQIREEATSNDERLQAVEFLACYGYSAEDARMIAKCLEPHFPDNIQAAALSALIESGQTSNTIFVLRKWKELSPRSRTTVLDFILGSQVSTRILLDQLDTKQIVAAEIDSIRRTKLTDHPEPSIRERARKLFSTATAPDRAKVVNEYWVQQFKSGDANAGAKIFAKQCAVCHKFGGQGNDVGPDLASVKDRSPEALLVAILDPNRAVEARYLNYVAVTKSGKTLTGILAQETGNSITLVAADGKKHDLLRTDLESLASTGKSLMPEGMEKELPPRDFADLIEYLKK